ncbi:hypothetical protein [Halomarina rubra]|uniref:Uncharacterized protein n=1 Tax=Halomarina rubra TaxID=2071873 RepID=A0ABD6AU11_9EURY|nr:hypothetical protein [Halomarina rubra]
MELRTILPAPPEARAHPCYELARALTVHDGVDEVVDLYPDGTVRFFIVRGEDHTTTLPRLMTYTLDAFDARVVSVRAEPGYGDGPLLEVVVGRCEEAGR